MSNGSYKPTKNRATQPYIKKRAQRKYAKPKRPYRKAVVGTNRRTYRYTKKSNQAIQIDIPACSKHYIKALFDPFTTDAGVCIPTGNFPIPSQKVKATIKGSFILGTTGYGFIALYPSLANDTVATYETGVTSVGGANTAASSFTNLSNSLFTRLPYTQADIETNKTVSGRVVAAGIRVRYAGREDARSGIWLGVEDQDHADLSLALTYNQLQQFYPNSESARPSGDDKWDMAVCYSGPTAPHMIEFVNVCYPIQPTEQTTVNPPSPIVIYCQGLAGDPIEFEASIHCEYIGRSVESKTPSHADDGTYGKVLQTAKGIAAEQPVKPSLLSGAWDSFVGKVSEAAPKLIELGTGIARMALMDDPSGLISTGAGMLLNSGSHDHGGGQRLTNTQRMIMA